MDPQIQQALHQTRLLQHGQHQHPAGRYAVQQAVDEGLPVVDGGHLHVEDHQVGTHPGDQSEQLRHLTRLAHDLDAGLRVQQRAQGLAQQSLLVRDHNAQGCVGHGRQHSCFPSEWSGFGVGNRPHRIGHRRCRQAGGGIHSG